MLPPSGACWPDALPLRRGKTIEHGSFLSPRLGQWPTRPPGRGGPALARRWAGPGRHGHRPGPYLSPPAISLARSPAPLPGKLPAGLCLPPGLRGGIDFPGRATGRAQHFPVAARAGPGTGADRHAWPDRLVSGASGRSRRRHTDLDPAHLSAPLGPLRPAVPRRSPAGRPLGAPGARELRRSANQAAQPAALVAGRAGSTCPGAPTPAPCFWIRTAWSRRPLPPIS